MRLQIMRLVNPNYMHSNSLSFPKEIREEIRREMACGWGEQSQHHTVIK